MIKFQHFHIEDVPSHHIINIEIYQTLIHKTDFDIKDNINKNVRAQLKMVISSTILTKTWTIDGRKKRNTKDDSLNNF